MGKLEVDVGESMDFFEALSWVKALGFDRVVVEGDAKGVVDAIAVSTSLISVYGD